MKLSPAKLAEIVHEPLPEIASLDLSGRGIAHIEDISVCVSLRRLNLAHNSLRSADALSGLNYMGTTITWIDLSHNQLESFEGIQRLLSLQVLKMSHNALNRISIHAERLTELKALVVNHNQIRVLDHLHPLKDLNTLVVSYNMLEKLPSLRPFAKLAKLSASHNQIRDVPDLSANHMLKELRLNDNKVVRLPDSLKTCASLEIIDLGNNLITDWREVEKLADLRHLSNLNLRGNPVCQAVPDYQKKLMEMIPSLKVLDGTRFDPKFLARREKKRRRQAQETAEAPDSKQKAVRAKDSDAKEVTGLRKRRTIKKGLSIKGR